MSNTDEVKATLSEKATAAFEALIGTFINNAVDLTIVFMLALLLGALFTRIFGFMGVPQLKLGNFVKRHGIFVLGLAAALTIATPLLDQFDVVRENISAFQR